METERRRNTVCVCPVCVCPVLIHQSSFFIGHHPEEDICWSSSPGWRTLQGDLKGCPGLSQTQWTRSVCRRTSRPSFCPSHESGSWSLSSSVQFGFQLHKNRLIFLKTVPFNCCWTHCCYHMGPSLRCQGHQTRKPSIWVQMNWMRTDQTFVGHTQLPPDVAAQQS